MKNVIGNMHFLEVLQLVGEAEALLLEHVQDGHVLLLDGVPLHQLQVRLVDLILQKPEPDFWNVIF